MDEFRVFGPPGTGKSTKLATDYIPDAVDKFGIDNVMVTSFTKAAAAEIATKKSRSTGKMIELPDGHVGTLHSICFNALGSPKIIETEKEVVKAWNELNPNFEITGKSASGSVDEAGDSEDKTPKGATHGDMLFNTIKIRRNRMTPMKFWQPEQKIFHEKWTQFKQETETVDFTDLIELALKKLDRAPGNPDVIFVDEAQDFTNLQLALVRSWAITMQYMVLVGDDDQALYTWAGVSSDALINPPIADDKKRVLKQSYRVPTAILENATHMIQRVAVREPKDYMPRIDRKTQQAAQGVVRESTGTWQEPEEIVDDVESKIRDGKSCMILASCSYMLKPMQAVLMSRGIPFENRYRRTRRDWNPLLRTESKDGRIDALSMLSAFFGAGQDASYWTVQQFLSWAQFLRTGDDGLRRKVGKVGIETLKKAVESKEQGLYTVREVIGQILTESAVEKALARDTQWFSDNLKAARKVDRLDYMIKVHRNNGIDALEDPPQLTIGTIHSVKGAEAQVVYLHPDISWQADCEMQNQGTTDGRDAIYRMFYVGMTRASEELVQCSPVSKGRGREPRMYVEF